MSKKKKHHYIPRFYLKRFSVNNDGKFLGLYNLKNKIFVKKAPLKHQACKNYLYGEDDEVEDALASMESEVAKMFYYWTEEKLLLPPPPETNGFKLLKNFILYQSYRTPKSGNDIMKTLNQSLKKVIKEFKPDLWESFKDSTLSHENPELLGLLNSIKHTKLLSFLDCKFMVNLSLLPFITSDAPVIYYNQLMEKAENYTGATGLVTKGLQIFYPIHPRLMICLYDPEIYDFGENNEGCASTESIEEVHNLNGLQFINSQSQLFFNQYISEEYIIELCNNYNKYRQSSKDINEVIKHGNRKFLFSSSESVHIDLELSFFKLKVEPRNFKNEMAPLRHPSFKRGK
ncbi:conserved protein of unknown function [Tenacibaculum soleae]|uniref:DUF4238 domain-containing protein n=1 Tax=Tenacibaculum soleae TaxID=447689 RepID=UPI003AB10C0C